MKAIHAVNAVLWQPGEQTHVSQTNKQTNKKPTDYYTRGRPRAPRVIILEETERGAWRESPCGACGAKN